MLKRWTGTTLAVAIFLSLCGAPLTGLALPIGAPAMQATSATPSRVLGTVTAVGKNSLTVKPAQGNPVTVTVGSSTRILQLEPGQRSLSDAKPIQLNAISPGDRTLISGTAGANNSLTANLVVAMKHSDIAARRRAEEEAWQRNGVGGIVKSVDVASSALILASTGHDITIKVPASISIRKYANNSVAYKDTQPSTLSAIQPGDQLRAKGSHSADGSVVTANAIVFGDFQNIAGLVTSIDPTAKTLTIKDLATHKPVTLSVDANSTLRQLPRRVAEFVAMRLHAMKQASKSSKSSGGKNPEASRRQYRRPNYPGAEHNYPGAEHAGPGQHGASGFNRVLDRATPIHLSDLHKGDVVMVVASKSLNNKPGTALTLLSGVAPMLRASRKASQSLFSSSWSLGGGQASGGGGGQGGGQGGGGQGNESGSQQKK